MTTESGSAEDFGHLRHAVLSAGNFRGTGGSEPCPGGGIRDQFAGNRPDGGQMIIFDDKGKQFG